MYTAFLFPRCFVSVRHTGTHPSSSSRDSWRLFFNPQFRDFWSLDLRVAQLAETLIAVLGGGVALFFALALLARQQLVSISDGAHHKTAGGGVVNSWGVVT